MFADEDFRDEDFTRTEYLPLRGVDKDLDALLKAFENCGNVRYETFNNLWLKMKFDRFYAGRQNERECREFAEECLKIVVESWHTGTTLHAKVGMFYLMYGLYFTQPIQPKAKIRVTLAMWTAINAFVGDVKLQKHLDIEYVFHTLRYHQAFHFVASAAWPVVNVRSQSSNAYLTHENDQAFREPSAVSEILQPDHIDQLSSIHDHYHRVKCKMAEAAGQRGDTPEASINIIQNNLVQVLTKAVTQHEVWRKTQGRKRAGRKRRDSGQTTTSESDMDSDSDFAVSPGKRSPKNQLSIRSEIKERAQRIVSIPNRGRQSTIVDEQTTSNSSPSSRRRKKRKSKQSADDSQTDDDYVPAASVKEENLLSMPTVQEDMQDNSCPILDLGTATQVSSISGKVEARGRGRGQRIPKGRGRGRGSGSRERKEQEQTLQAGKTKQGRGRQKKIAEEGDNVETAKSIETVSKGKISEVNNWTAIKDPTERETVDVEATKGTTKTTKEKKARKGPPKRRGRPPKTK